MNSNIYIKRTILKSTQVPVLIFLFFFMYYFLFGYHENVAPYLVFMEFFLALLYGWMLITNSHNDISTKPSYYVIILLYSFFIAFLLRWLFIEFTGEIFQEAGDSYAYDEFAMISVQKGWNLQSHLAAVDEEALLGLSIDDYGFNIIVYYCYRLFGVAGGRWMLLFLNAFCIMLSALYLAKLFKLFGFSPIVMSFCISSYAFFTFFPVTAAVGLKENFFLLIITMSLLFSYKYKNYHRLKHLILSILSTLLAFMFRLPVGVMLTLTLLACLIINEKNHKKIILFSAIVLLCIFLFMGVVFQLVFGVSLEEVLNVSKNRMGDNNSASWLIQLLSAIIGPFPNYSRAVQYGILSSFALQLKCILNFYAFLALYNIIKKGEYQLYWVGLYFLMGIVMLTVAAVSLDMRYHATFYPALIILVGYALNYTKINKIYFSMYNIVLIAIVFFYNNR